MVGKGIHHLCHKRYRKVAEEDHIVCQLCALREIDKKDSKNKLKPKDIRISKYELL